MHLSATVAGVSALAVLGAGAPALADADSASAAPDLSRFYTQEIPWAACDGAQGGTGEDMPDAATDGRAAQCGQLTVPLDYADPGAGTVDLALFRLRSTGKPRGSLLVNFGGPGGAGVAGLAYGMKKFGDLAKGYDVVSFDPRGVARSSPVSCAGATTPDPTEEGKVPPAQALKQLRQTADKCVRNSGPVLAHIGTVNVSRDMDVMRQALGDEKLNYLGLSYGTRIGAVYAAQFPHKVGRMALDGVDTLTEPAPVQSLAVAEGLQTALDRFTDWCADNPGCVLGSDRRAAKARVLKLVKDLDAAPLDFDGAQVTGQTVVGPLSDALYHRSSWPAISQALSGLITYSNPRPLFDLRDMAGAGAGRGITIPSKIPDDNAEAALMAVNCADAPERPSADELTGKLPALEKEFNDASPVFGKSMMSLMLLCFGRPAGTRYIRDDVRDVDTPKLLLVGTRGDPATPYRWTQETAKRLGSSAVVLDNRGDGHIGYMGSKCAKQKVDDFLLYGQLPAGGGSCPAE
ncbi:alpha/beta hydrolase [Streptomyces sp. T-3]|nr:alpha/beta hydrolase [Streptomyces sp. T-3]